MLLFDLDRRMAASANPGTQARLRVVSQAIDLLRYSLLREEQVRANGIVGEIAGLLPCPTAEETLAELSEVPVLGAEYFGWQLHVYVNLVEEEFDCPLGLWVLILSRGSERAFRVFEGDDFYEAARHIRRFVRDAA